MKRLLSMMAAAAAVLLTGACSPHDPEYPTPPKLDIASVRLEGVVTDRNGNPIPNAVITVPGVGVFITDEEGFYTTESLLPNKDMIYPVVASADGMYSRPAEVRVEKTDKDVILFQNFVLYRVSPIVPFERNPITGEIEGLVLTDYIIHNNNAEVEVFGRVVDCPPGCAFTLQLFYDVTEFPWEQAKMTKAPYVEEEMFFCYHFAQTAGPTTPATFAISINEEVQGQTSIRRYDEDADLWEDVRYRSTPDTAYLEQVLPGYYGVFCDVTKDILTSVEPLEVEPDTLDNLYGSRDRLLTSIVYSYTSGVEISTYQGVDQLKALLLEELAYDYGLNGVTRIRTIPVDVTVPVGTAIILSASQTEDDITYTRHGKSVHGYIYDAVNMRYVSFNRRHTGGGN